MRSTKSELFWREQEGKTSGGLAFPRQSLENPHTAAAGEVALRNHDAVSPVLIGALGLGERHFEINVLQAWLAEQQMVSCVFCGVLTEVFLLTRVVESPVPMLRDLTQNSAVRSVNSGLSCQAVQNSKH